MAMTEEQVMARMDAAEKMAAERAANAKNGTFVPTFIRLSDGQRMKIRPLVNLYQSAVLQTHKKYLKAENKYLNAVCSVEIEKECPHCAAAKNNKDRELEAAETFMLPVYVNVLEKKNDSGVWVPVTYQKDGVDFEVSGLRVLELKSFGSINQVFKFLRDLYREDASHDIRQYGLIVERSDVNPKNPTYTILPKGPTPMPDVAKSFIPTQDAVRQMVMQACPPAGTTVVTAAVATSSQVSAKDNDF